MPVHTEGQAIRHGGWAAWGPAIGALKRCQTPEGGQSAVGSRDGQVISDRVQVDLPSLNSILLPVFAQLSTVSLVSSWQKWPR